VGGFVLDVLDNYGEENNKSGVRLILSFLAKDWGAAVHPYYQIPHRVASYLRGEKQY
jgi:hypothetical protein